MRDTVDAAPSAEVLDEIEQLVTHPARWLSSQPMGRAIRDTHGLAALDTTVAGVHTAAHHLAGRLPDRNLSPESHSPAPGQLQRASGQPSALRSTRVATFDALWEGNTALLTLMSVVNASYDGILARISQHDRCVVNTSRQIHSVQVSQVLQAERDGADRWLMVYDWEVTTPGAPQIVGLRNCRFGRVVVDHEAHILVAELVFHRPLMTGETLIMGYQVINPTSNHDTTADSYCRRQRLPVRDYALEVQFDHDALPLRCQQVSAPPSNPWTVHRSDLSVSSTSNVHTVALNASPGLFGISWYWPPGIPTPHKSLPST
jgi:hypothetical protein